MELWEAAHTLAAPEPRDELAAGGAATGAPSPASLLLRLLHECPASTCPFPGLITYYSATPHSFTRLASLLETLGVF